LRRERVKDLLVYERAKVRKRKSPQCIQGGGDVHPGQVEAPEKVLLTSTVSSGKKKSFSPPSEFRQEKVLLTSE